MIPGAVGAHLYDIAGELLMFGGQFLQPFHGVDHPAVVSPESGAVYVADEPQLFVRADGAMLIGRFADVASCSEELWVGIADVRRADQAPTNLQDEGTARQGVVDDLTRG